MPLTEEQIQRLRDENGLSEEEIAKIVAQVAKTEKYNPWTPTEGMGTLTGGFLYK
jgi:hypothetical protein